MGNLQIEFDASFPETVRPLVEGLLTEYSWLCPSSMQKLCVSFDENEDSAASIESLPQYRMAKLVISGVFLTDTFEYQKDTIIHELLHYYTAPIKDACVDGMKDAGVDKNVRNILKRHIEEKMEQATQDLAFVIGKQFIKKEKK